MHQCFQSEEVTLYALYAPAVGEAVLQRAFFFALDGLKEILE